jgi:hypothetical protein
MDCTNGYIMSDETLGIGRFGAMIEDSKPWDNEKGGLSVDNLVARIASYTSHKGWGGKGCSEGVN